MFGFSSKPKKKAVLVIPPKQYDDGELHAIEKIFKRYHIKCVYASTSVLGTVASMHKETLKPELNITDTKMEEFDALIMIGGTGAREFYNDMNVHRLIQKANQLDKVIGAIDYAPIILAHAEILKHKCATVLVTEEQKLQASGAHYTGSNVEIDGNIVTANNSAHALEFADAVARLVHG
jgi:protease I